MEEFVTESTSAQIDPPLGGYLAHVLADRLLDCRCGGQIARDPDHRIQIRAATELLKRFDTLPLDTEKAQMHRLLEACL